jgi:predicted nucleic acid-binding Zn ribbon protein
VALDEMQAELVPETLLAEVQAIWRSAVGEMIAEQARPVSQRGGVLTIGCSASVWAHELDLMAPSIIERLNAALGGAEVTRMRCVTTTS